MKCAICNNEISDEEIEENCITCIISDAKGITISEMAELWQARAEKAEGELKAIKEIWADGEYLDNARETLKLIEKIGGEK